MANTAAAAGEDGPVAGFELGFDKGAVDGRAGTHDWAGGEVVDAIGDAGCVAGWGSDVLLIRPCYLSAPGVMMEAGLRGRRKDSPATINPVATAC